MSNLKKIRPRLMAALLTGVFSGAVAAGPAGGDMSCPDSPNCVSSRAGDARHFIEPFVFHDQPASAMQRLREALLTEKRVTIVAEQADYLHAEARSLLFRFVDDIEFTLAAQPGVIHVRSAARTGYSDLGVNRRRIERIRRAFRQ